MIELILMFCAWLFLAWVFGGRKDCTPEVASLRAQALRGDVEAGKRLIDSGCTDPELRAVNAELERYAEAYERRARGL